MEKPSSDKTLPCASPTVTRSWGQFPKKKKKKNKEQEQGSISSNNCAKRKKQQRANEKHQTQKTITSARQRQFRLQNCQTKKDFEFQLQRERERREGKRGREQRSRCSSFRFSYVRFGLISPSSELIPQRVTRCSACAFRVTNATAKHAQTCTDASSPGHAHTTDHHKS